MQSKRREILFRIFIPQGQGPVVCLSVCDAITGRPWALMVVTDDARLQAAGLEAKEDVSWAHGPRLRAKGISPQNEYRCAVGHCEGPSSPRDAGVGPLERPALHLSSDSTSAGLRLKMDPLFKNISILH